MKEIKKKIKDSIFGDFNQELIGDKVTLQNKVNKFQRMIDMINYLQPIEKEEFVLPEYYTVKVANNEDFLFVLDYLCKDAESYHKEGFKKHSENGIYYIGNSSEGWFYNHTNNNTQNPEITFEQFKKYVLNN